MKKKFIYSLLALIIAASCITFAGCGKSKNSYSIVVQSLHYNLGSIEGGNKEYFEGDEVSIKAIPTQSASNSSNPEFICWLLDNKVVSTSAEYTFVVSNQTAGNYLALFTCPNLEYFSLDNLTLNSGIDTTLNQNTTIKKVAIYAGALENLLTQIYYNETLPNGITFNLYNTDIYATDAMPYAYDMQENIYLKFEITYEQDGVTFISNTTAKIDGTNDVTIETLGINEIPLNTAKNVENPDLTISLANTPSLTINFARLTTFNLPQDTPEE